MASEPRPAAGGRAAASVSRYAPATAGTFYYGACVRAVFGEVDTGNNCSPSVSIVVQ